MPNAEYLPTSLTKRYFDKLSDFWKILYRDALLSLATLSFEILAQGGIRLQYTVGLVSYVRPCTAQFDELEQSAQRIYIDTSKCSIIEVM